MRIFLVYYGIKFRRVLSCTTQGGNKKLFQKTGGEKLMEENYSAADEYDNLEDIFEDIP